MEKEKTKDEGQGSGSKADSELYNFSYLAHALVLRYFSLSVPFSAGISV